MTRCTAEDVPFQSATERRRPISKILPHISQEPDLSSHHWSNAISWIIAVVVLISTQSFTEHRPSKQLSSLHHPSFAGGPNYRWFGFHRIAP